MADILSLSKARKQKARAGKDAQAAETEPVSASQPRKCAWRVAVQPLRMERSGTG